MADKEETKKKRGTKNKKQERSKERTNGKKQKNQTRRKKRKGDKGDKQTRRDQRQETKKDRRTTRTIFYFFLNIGKIRKTTQHYIELRVIQQRAMAGKVKNMLLVASSQRGRERCADSDR